MLILILIFKFCNNFQMTKAEFDLFTQLILSKETVFDKVEHFTSATFYLITVKLTFTPLFKS